MQNITEIVPGEPRHRGLNVRGVAKYSDFGPVEGYISVIGARYNLGYN